MTGGEVAALIAAVAFVVLVVVVAVAGMMIIPKMSKTLDKTNQAVDEADRKSVV